MAGAGGRRQGRTEGSIRHQAGCSDIIHHTWDRVPGDFDIATAPRRSSLQVLAEQGPLSRKIRRDCIRFLPRGVRNRFISPPRCLSRRRQVGVVIAGTTFADAACTDAVRAN